ncbi:unnamed protein product [Symbiodinium sp. KB8]|nr:unnamed protein product [Symbiodinium sp. KB8]
MDPSFGAALDSMILEAMSASGRLEGLALPWESGALALVFGGTPLVAEPMLAAESASDFRSIPVQSSVSSTSAGMPSVCPDSVLSFTAKSFSRGRLVEEERWELVYMGWLQILQAHSGGSEIADILEEAQEEHAKVACVRQLFGGKALTTLEKRLRQARHYLKWAHETGSEAFPIGNHQVRMYIKQLLKDNAPPSKVLGAGEIVNFLAYVVGLPVAVTATKTPWVKGVMRQSRSEKGAPKQARALTTVEVALLESLLRNEDVHVQDRFAAGAMLFMVYSRARYGDTKIVSQMIPDLVEVRHAATAGYLELTSYSHKMRRVKAALPLVAPALGVGHVAWGPVFIKVADLAGLPFSRLDGCRGALLPVPRGDSWSKEPCSTGDAACWLRALLRKATGEEPPKLSAHSMKSTTLAWCAKFGISRDDRLILGHHSENGSAEVYARDVQAAPLRSLEGCLQAIRNSRFYPDMSRSGYLGVAEGQATCVEGSTQSGGRGSTDSHALHAAAAAFATFGKKAEAQDEGSAGEDDRRSAERSPCPGESSLGDDGSEPRLDPFFHYDPEADAGDRVSLNGDNCGEKPKGFQAEDASPALASQAPLEDDNEDSGDDLSSSSTSTSSSEAESNPGLPPVPAAPWRDGCVDWGDVCMRTVDNDCPCACVEERSCTSPDESDLRGLVTLPAGVEGSDAKPKELPAEERRYRLSAQERRLSGMVLKGPLEVAYSAYDLVVKMLADDHITYLAPHRFSTRMLEVQQDRPSKSIVIDATQHLQVKDMASQKPQVDLPDALSLTQAMTRRSLALDLVGAATFARAEAWNRVLVQHLQQPPPPGFKFMDTAQLLRADRAGWLHMAQVLTTLRRGSDGTLPMDAAFDSLPTVPAIMFHLAPQQGGRTTTTTNQTLADAPTGTAEGKMTKSARRRASLKRRLGGASTVTTPPPPPPAVERPTKQHTGKGGAKRTFPEFMLNSLFARLCEAQSQVAATNRAFDLCARVFRFAHQVRNLPHVYPTNFCRAFAMCIVNKLVLAGAKPSPTSLSPEHTRLHIASRIAVGTQPSRSKAAPLIPEFKCLCKLSGAWDSLPAGPALRTSFKPSDCGLSCTPAAHVLPSGARVFSRLPITMGEGGQSPSLETSCTPDFSIGATQDPVSLETSGSPKVPIGATHDSAPLVSPKTFGDPRDFIVSAPANPHSGSLEKGEQLAGDLLCKGDFSVRCCLDVLRASFSSAATRFRKCLDKDRETANYFVLGGFVAAERRGVTSLTSKLPKTVSYLNAFLRARFPSLPWTSVALSHNEMSSIHADSNEPGTDNGTIGLGSYKGGGLWLECDGGGVKSPSKCADKFLWGRVANTRESPFIFNGRTRHATMPWEGDRWVLTVYVVGGSACLPHSSWGTLDNLGFPRGHWGPSVGPATPDALPSNVAQGECLVGVQWQPEEFIQEAVRRGHPKRMFSGVPPVLERVIKENASTTGADTAKWRTEQLRRWTLRAEELRNEEAALKDSEAPHLKKILSPKRLCLMREMIRETGYRDVGLLDDLCKGFEVTGEIPRSHVYRVSPAYATLSPTELRAKAALTRKCILDSVAKSCTSDLAAEVYAATQEEVSNGWLDGPLDADALDPCVSVTRRFGVRQGSGESARVRPIDNFTESLVNHTTFREETIEPHTVDVVCASLAMRLRARREVGKSTDTVLKATDLRKAYKQLGVSENALQDAHLAVANPATGRAEVYMSKVLPFGSCSAVNGFCRASSCLWYLGVMLLAFEWTVYYDDFFSFTERHVAKHTNMCIGAYFALMGWQISENKELDFAPYAKILGVKICMASATLFYVENTADRKAELSDTIDALLTTGAYTEHELESLRGRLHFAEGQVFGRQGAMAMKVLNRKIDDDKRRGTVSAELAAALAVLKNRVVNGPPRAVSTRLANDWFVFTDACFEAERPEWTAGIGGVLVAPDGKKVSCFGLCCEVDVLKILGLSDKANPIYELEALAVLAAFDTWHGVLREAGVVCFVDNDGVLGSFVGCKSSSASFTSFLKAVTRFESFAAITPWFERVSSIANVADGPSRGDFGAVKTVNRASVDPDRLAKAVVQGTLPCIPVDFPHT